MNREGVGQIFEACCDKLNFDSFWLSLCIESHVEYFKMKFIQFHFTNNFISGMLEIYWNTILINQEFMKEGIKTMIYEQINRLS